MKITVFARISVICATCGLSLFAASQNKNSDHPFYENSLHYSSRGLAHWYAKENGGLERITGVPFTELSGCNACHVRNCDTCHAADSAGKSAYSVTTAKSETACDNCHDIEARTFARKHPGDPAADVHFGRGMKCMDCHSSREVHGDGTIYVSMNAPGAMDARCEHCHSDGSCPDSKVHGAKLDCTACHVREVSSCYNCHFETRIKEGKSVSLPLTGMLFLINHDGAVTVGNLHTFVYRKKTMIVFAPAFPHSITKKGRQCSDCHHTPAVEQLLAGTFKPVNWDKAGLKNATGIIPVLDGYDWQFPFLEYANGEWKIAEDVAPPVLNYSGYSQPLSRKQVAAMAERHSK